MVAFLRHSVIASRAHLGHEPVSAQKSQESRGPGRGFLAGRLGRELLREQMSPQILVSEALQQELTSQQHLEYASLLRAGRSQGTVRRPSWVLLLLTGSSTCLTGETSPTTAKASR